MTRSKFLQSKPDAQNGGRLRVSLELYNFKTKQWVEVNQNLYPDLYQMSVMDAGGTVIEYDRPEHKAFIGADPNRFPGFLYEYVKWRIRLTNENKQVGYGSREGRIDIWMRADF